MAGTDPGVAEVLARLERRGTARNRDGMARYGIVAKQVFGVSVAELRLMARGLGRDHALALALWKTGWYEARMLSGFVDEPERVTVAQMDAQARGFDNWAICDHLCFHLYDRTPHAFGRVRAWSRRREEFVRRAAFALLASLALHDKATGDAPFLRTLPLIERAATDERNFVKKGVSWALRGVGRRSAVLHAESLELARRLADSEVAAARWVGKDALKDLSRPAVTRRFARGDAASRKNPARGSMAPVAPALERVAQYEAGAARKRAAGRR
jgi:3-methyladenine DNA glycosylase AlkD